MNRRGFLLGLGAALAAPAIVRASNLMAVRGIVEPPLFDGEIGEFVGVLIREETLTMEHVRRAKEWARRQPRMAEVLPGFYAMTIDRDWDALLRTGHGRSQLTALLDYR